MDPLKPRERLLGPALRTQPDRRLVALARDGSVPAQEEIVRRYRAALVRYAGSIVGAAAAEDVVQEALAKAVAALGRSDEELRLRPWLYAIVRNTALNHLRDAGPATEQLDESCDGVEQPPQALERRERVRSLVGGLRGLPRPQREALVKRELEGRSHEEIAAELGVSSGAARQLIFRAREALRAGFGSLLPMPLLRWLAEGGSGEVAVGAAAGAGGGALATKAALAVFAAGAAVTAGVAIDHGAKQRPGEPPAAEARARPAVPATAGAGTATAPIVADDDAGQRGRSDSSGPGSGGEREDGEDRDGEDRDRERAEEARDDDRRGRDGEPDRGERAEPERGDEEREGLASGERERGRGGGGGGSSRRDGSGQSDDDLEVAAAASVPASAPAEERADDSGSGSSSDGEDELTE